MNKFRNIAMIICLLATIAGSIMMVIGGVALFTLNPAGFGLLGAGAAIGTMSYFMMLLVSGKLSGIIK
ncbi:MAG: hypothetical protein J6U54_13810 [Clostridiales bacterium]|nr:hypothetical protein [Clostridiales bacterium]